VKVTLVLEGMGDRKVCATSSAWAEAKVILAGQSPQVQAIRASILGRCESTGSKRSSTEEALCGGGMHFDSKKVAPEGSPRFL
jgi:hypothetical protein